MKVNKKQKQQTKKDHHNSFRRGKSHLSTYDIKRSGCSIVKKDGTVFDIIPKSIPISSDKDGLWIVSPLREKQILDKVKLAYFDYDLPSLARELKSYRGDAIRIDAKSAADLTGIHINGSVEIDVKAKNKRKDKNIIMIKNTQHTVVRVELSYAYPDSDGKIVLAIKDIGNPNYRVYLKLDDSGKFLFKQSENPESSQFIPFNKGLIDNDRFKHIRRTLLFLNEKTAKSYNEYIMSLKTEYVRAIGRYFVFLECHGYTDKVARMLNEERSQEQQELSLPYTAISHGIAFDERSRNSIHDGDKICCRFTTVVIVVNTFQCLAKHHDMVSVILEVLIKDTEKDMPFVRELEAYYCKQCNKVFMYNEQFNRLDSMIRDRRYRIFNRFVVDGNQYGYTGKIADTWADESILKEAGYKVNRDSTLSQQERLGILVSLNRRGLSFHAIVSYLNTFITVLGSASSRDMTQAVQRWKADLDAVEKMHAAKVIH